MYRKIALKRCRKSIIKLEWKKSKKRKETIERVFADGKEKHGMRYMQYRGLAEVIMELTLLFEYIPLKKLTIWKWRKEA